MFRTIIGEIGIFMICAQAIMHFRPKEVYGKYLRLLFSVMILVMILQPFLALFYGNGELDLAGSVQEFQKNMEQDMEEAVKKAASSQEQLEEISLEMVQERMEQENIIEVTPVEEICITKEAENE